MVSDPIERYRSRLDYTRLLPATTDERRYFADFLTDAARRGRYAAQLSALRTWVEPERILVQQLERCEEDPLGEYRRLLRFLELDDFVPRRFRRLAQGKPPAIAPVRALHALGLPEGALGATRRWARRTVRQWLRGPYPEPAVLWPEIEAALHDMLDADVAALPSLAPHVDISLWPSFRDVR
jgi:hypothetical protein